MKSGAARRNENGSKRIQLEALRDYEWSWLLNWLKGVPTPPQPCSAALSDMKMMLVSEGLPALVTQPSFDEGD